MPDNDEAEIASLRAELAEAHKCIADQTDGLLEIARLREALERLVAKLTAVEADESFKGIWGLLHAHGYRYSGPDWHDELADARAALAYVLDELVRSARLVSNIRKPWSDNNYGRAASALAWCLPSDDARHPNNGGPWNGDDIACRPQGENRKSPG